MIEALQPFGGWMGEWIGAGESDNGAEVKVRLWLTRRLHGEAIGLRLEVSLPGALSPGIAALGALGTGPDRRLRLALWSS
ncbi:MAG: hypothetical protein KJ044_12085, partial [Planctomycetes bacterium]|nr:hypothetical protein [Planctomycetota bacterium]